MSNQFNLLKKRRFLPLFVTQFLGAFNDNVYKNAVIILIAFSAASLSHFSSNTLINIAGALFIAPYLFLSASFGQIADKFEKSKLIRLTKILEICVALVATAAFLLNSIWLLLLALFLLGTQSTLFGPVKYSILPQHLKSFELLGGNGLIEMGTFVAILTGTILGGILIAIPHTGRYYVSAAVIIIAILGYLSSRKIPKAPSASPDLKISWNIFKSSWKTLIEAKQNRAVFLSIFGISWFWFFGAFMLYQTPNFVKIYLGGNEHIVTLVLACFSIGIGLGALICEKLSRRVIEIGLVPIAALGLSLFTADLYYLQSHQAHITNQTLAQFLHTSHNWWVLFDIAVIGFFGGLYNVPLYALIQDRSKREHRSRIIAVNNIINAFAMILSAVFAITLLHFGMTIPELFIVVAILNACLTLYLFYLMPEFVIRLIVWLVINTMYRIKIKGIENLPHRGPAIYACNHVSFVDVMVISAASTAPVRYLMDHRLFNAPVLGFISRLGKAIPIAPAKEDAELKEKAFATAAEALKNNQVVGIFPEGGITRDGEIAEFKRGIEDLIDRQPAHVIPMALHGMWGSWFSRKYGKAMSTRPRRFWSKIILNIGEPIPAQEVNADMLQAEIQRLYDTAEESK